MVSSIGASTNISSVISTDQKQQLTELLSDYDVNNLSADDAEDIMSSIDSIGIEEGKALGKLIADNGFNAETIGALADEADPSIATEIVSFLSDLVLSYDDESSDEENKESLLAVVSEKFGLDDLGSLFDFEV